MKNKLFILFSFVSLLSIAQPGKEATHWYFGSKYQLDFSSGVPIPGISSFIYFVYEGCASISDVNTGQYLFSSQGNKILNKNLTVMNNGSGIYGVTNSTQGSLIIPKPGSSSIYYVFTGNALGGTQGIHYSVVDMSLMGGLGQVTLKNQVLTPPPTTEKMVGAKHCNGTDYWVLTMTRGTNTFNAYVVTAAGINTTPVVSNSGTVLTYYGGTSMDYPGCGYMKISPNGKKLAVGSNSDSIPILQIFDFDNVTGVVSNPMTISYPGLWGPYGLTFSPDNSKLYAAAHRDSSSWLYQYDLSSGTPSTIIASQILIAQTKGHYANLYTGDLAAMQMAPDGKVYITRYQNDTICTINNPNNLGLACNFQLAGIIMPNVSGAYCTNGLPNFIDANYAGININMPDVYLCSSVPTATLDAGPGFANYFWSTGASTQTISVSSPGQYWVTVTNDQGCTRTDTMSTYVVQGFKIDTVVCDSFHANVIQAGATQYIWYDSTSNPIKNISQSGHYYVDVTFSGGCLLRDSITTAVITSPHVDLGPPVSLCDFKLDLNAYYPGTTINWSTGATTSSITVNQPGIYWVKLQDTSGCVGSDTLVISPPWQLTNLNMPNIVTPNGDKINDEIDFTKFEFSAFTITIYNRWGQKIFESNEVDAIWKPTVDDGTYFYTAQYKIDCGTDSQTRNIKGYIQVLR